MEAISRRKFIQLTSVTGAFLAIGCVPDVSGSESLVSSLTDDPSKIDLNQFISIGTDGSIVLFNHRPEMGQGTYQSIPMILAEELEVDIDKIEIRQSVASRDLYGSQMVVGSRSIQTEFDKLRKMGAAAREMLKQAAANKWKADVSTCTASDGTVTNSSGDQLTYAELVTEASKLKPSDSPPLKAKADFKVVGKEISRRDIPFKTNGSAKFGIDHSIPGMLYASIERSPQFLGK